MENTIQQQTNQQAANSQPAATIPPVLKVEQVQTENKVEGDLNKKSETPVNTQKKSYIKQKFKELISKIPYFGTPDMPLRSTTQDHLPIADITNDIVLFKDGGASIVLESSSLNFGLLSEKEQQAVVAAFAALINSLSFSMQIVVRTQRKDISGYINYFDRESAKIVNPKLKAITEDYRHFITDSIKKKTVLGKRFFIVIPFSALELGVTKSAQSILKKGPLPFPKDYVMKKAKITLFPKRDHLVRQAGRLGLRLKQLNTNELIELYYQINNPEPPAVKKDI